MNNKDMRKLILFLFAMMLIPVMAVTQTSALGIDVAPAATDTIPTHLVVWHKDGTQVMFSLEGTPKIVHWGDNVIIESSTIVEYEFQAIIKMTYVKAEDYMGIENLPIVVEKPFFRRGGFLSFPIADIDRHVRVLSVDGRLLRDFVVPRGDTTSLSLSAFSSNIYLIIVNGVTYKINVR